MLMAAIDSVFPLLQTLCNLCLFSIKIKNISIYLRRKVELCCETYTLMASPWCVGGKEGAVFICKHLVGAGWAHIW